MTNRTDEAEEISKREEPYDASNAASVNAARKRASRHKYDRLEVMKALLQNKPTRQWLWEVLTFCNAYSQSFVQGSPDGTAFNEGRRSVGNKILTEALEADENGVVKMLKEGKSYNQ